MLQWKAQNICRLFSFKRKQLLSRSGVSGNDFQEHDKEKGVKNPETATHSALSGVWFLLESAHMQMLFHCSFLMNNPHLSLSLIYIVVAGEMAEARLIEQMTKIFGSQQIKESLIILISPLGKHSSFCFTNVVHPTSVE